MKNNNIRVQFLNHITVASACSAENFESAKHPLTFHAFSDTMKARMLETFLNPANKGRIAISFTSEQPKTGEWHEPLASDAIINH